MRTYICQAILIMSCVGGFSRLSAQEDVSQITQGSWVHETDNKTLTVMEINIREKDDFIKAIFNTFGIKVCSNGVREFKRVALQGVGEELTLIMVEGVWKPLKKGEGKEFTAVCKDEMKPLKEGESRGIRLAVVASEGVDCLADGAKQDAFRRWLINVISTVSN